MSKETRPKSGLSVVPDRVLSNGPGMPARAVSCLGFLSRFHVYGSIVRTAPSRISLRQTLTILPLRRRRGTWDPHHLVTEDTRTLIMDLGQGYNREVGNPHDETWTMLCVSRYGDCFRASFSSKLTITPSVVKRDTMPIIARTATNQETEEGSIGRRGGSRIRVVLWFIECGIE